MELDFERYRLWLLKNSLSTQNSPKLGNPKRLGIRKRRLNRIVMQSYFRKFLEKEFFNSHTGVGVEKVTEIVRLCCSVVLAGSFLVTSWRPPMALSAG